MHVDGTSFLFRVQLLLDTQGKFVALKGKFHGSGIGKMEVNKQDFLQVFQGSGIEKMGGYFNECQPAF